MFVCLVNWRKANFYVLKVPFFFFFFNLVFIKFLLLFFFPVFSFSFRYFLFSQTEVSFLSWRVISAKSSSFFLNILFCLFACCVNWGKENLYIYIYARLMNLMFMFTLFAFSTEHWNFCLFGFQARENLWSRNCFVFFFFFLIFLLCIFRNWMEFYLNFMACSIWNFCSILFCWDWCSIFVLTVLLCTLLRKG